MIKMKVKLTKSEKKALDYLKKAYEKYPEPLITVHSPYGLTAYYGKGIKYWLKVLLSLEKKGLVTINKRNMVTILKS